MLLALLVVSSWDCARSKPTSSGELVHWDKTMETEVEVLAAKEIGPRTSKDVVIVAQPSVKGPVTIKLHFETAQLEIAWDSGTERPSSPVAARVLVDANGDWTLSSQCDEGLHRRLGQSERMIKSCRIVMKHQDSSLDVTTSFTLDMDGDGTVKPEGLDFKFTVSG